MRLGLGLGLTAPRGPRVAFPDDPYLFLLADPAEMTQVSDGGGGAPAATNDPVGLWQDTSGNDRHFSQATADPRGLYVPASGSARPRVKFGAPSRRLTRSSVGPTGAQSWGVVFKLNSTPGGGLFYLLARLAAGSGTGLGELYACNSGSYRSLYWRLSFTAGAGNGVGFSPALDTSRHRLLVVYDGSGSTTVGAYQAWYDGAPVTLLASGSNTGIAGATASIGCGQGASAEALSPADTDIEVFSVYDRALTAGEVAAWNTAAGA